MGNISVEEHIGKIQRFLNAGSFGEGKAIMRKASLYLHFAFSC